MHRFIEKAQAAAFLALGVTMLVWGGRVFSRNEPSKFLVDEELGGVCLCPPTVGEIAETFGIGLAVRKLACLWVAGLGMFLAGGSALSIVLKTQQRPATDD